MASESQVREILQVVVLCIIYYIVSSGNGVLTKLVLSEFPYPMTVTMVQLMTVTFGSGPLFALWRVRIDTDIPRSYYWKVIVPLAFGKFFSCVSSNISILKVPVSYAHTVKATMPLFTVILSRIIMGEKQTLKVYFSLIPIILGVLIATYSEISFNVIGLISALCATVGFSLLHIFSKKVLSETTIHHFQLLHILARLSLLFFLPIWLVHDLRNVLNDDELFQNSNQTTVGLMLILDGSCYLAQNIVAFSILSLVSPLTYSITNATKRISVILVSILLLGNPVSSFNFFGMMLAIIGVLGYNKAKYDANQAKRKATTLPITTTTNGINNALLKFGNSDYHPLSTKTITFNDSPIQNGYTHHHQQHMSNGGRTHNFI